MKIATVLCLLVLLLGVLPTGFAQGDERQTITPDNASQLVELIRLGRGSTEHVAYSPDGQLIAVASTVGAWLYAASALDTPTEPVLLPTSKAIASMAFSTDGVVLATASDGAIQLWDVASHGLLGTIEINTTSHGIAFSPDNTLLAINIGRGGIKLWDVVNNVEQAVLEGNLQGDAAVVFSPDGSLIAGTSTDYAVRVWRVADASEVAVFTGHSRFVYNFAFSLDGATLASVSYDKTVRLWDIVSGSELAVLEGTDEQPLKEAYSLAISPDGALLASGYAEGKIAVWDLAGRTLKAVFGVGGGNIIDLAFNPDGSRLVSASSRNIAQLWDVASGEEITATVGHTGTINAVVFNPDSSILAIVDYEKNLWLWDTASMQELNFAVSVADSSTFSAENTSMLVFSPDGSLIASTDGFDVLLTDPAAQTQVRKLESCRGLVRTFAFSPDNSLVAQATSDSLCVSNVATGELLTSFPSGDWLEGVAFSPDQTLIAIASRDNTVRVYGLP